MKKTTIISGLIFASVLNAQSFAPHSTGTVVSVDTNYIQRGGVTSITQNTDTSTVLTPLSVACPGDDDSYYRRFNLDGDHAIAGQFDVSSVDIGIENAVGNGGTQPVVINLYALANADAFELANLSLVGTLNAEVLDGDALTVKNFPITGSVDGSTHDLVVELFSSDFNDGNTFFIGSNSAGQSAPTFLRSPGCGADEPTDVATLGDFGLMHQIMVVNGEEPVPVELMNFSVE